VDLSQPHKRWMLSIADCYAWRRAVDGGASVRPALAPCPPPPTPSTPNGLVGDDTRAWFDGGTRHDSRAVTLPKPCSSWVPLGWMSQCVMRPPLRPLRFSLALWHCGRRAMAAPCSRKSRAPRWPGEPSSTPLSSPTATSTSAPQPAEAPSQHSPNLPFVCGKSPLSLRLILLHSHHPPLSCNPSLCGSQESRSFGQESVDLECLVLRARVCNESVT